MLKKTATATFLVALVTGVSACSGSAHQTVSAGAAKSSAQAATLSGPAATRAWVAAENAKPGTIAWELPQTKWAPDTELAGWLDHTSVLPGQSVRMLTTATVASYTVTAYRMGYYANHAGRAVWKSGALRGVRQPACLVRAHRMVDCSNWKQTLKVNTTGWPEGLYLLKLNGSDGKSKYIPLTLRSRSTAGKLVLVSADATYEAYNNYGGYSLYTGKSGFADRANVVSFNRPYDRSGARYVTAGERQIADLAEHLDLPVAYETDTDIAGNPGLLKGAAGVVAPNHDEYWNTAMRTAYTGARDHGTNLAFMGANVEYWRVRFQDSYRQMVGYKSAALDPLKNNVDSTALWRDAPHARPENALVGLMYACFPAPGALKVTDPGFWMFKGTGAKAGSTYPGVVGVEIDRAYPIAGTPKTLEVAAHSPVQCGTHGRTYSDLAYYTAPSGAGVFASGSMGFAIGIGGINTAAGITAASSTFVKKVTQNLFTAMVAGPMGKAHPAHPNLASLHESASSSTGSGSNTGSDLGDDN